jgi:hypothetical protein
MRPGTSRRIERARFAMRREILGHIAMQPEENPIRGLSGNYVFSYRPNL